MQNQATRWLAKYIAQHHISIEEIEQKLHISREKLMVDTKQSLYATEFLELCNYLQIEPEDIPMDRKR